MATLGSLPGVSVGLALESTNFSTGIARAQRQTEQLTTSVRRSSGLMRSNFANVGFQVQDMAVQIAGGTSALRAMTQQLPQLAGGFGPVGIAIGAAVSVAGALATSLVGVGREAENAAKLATTEFEQLRKVMADIRGDVDVTRSALEASSRNIIAAGERRVAELERQIEEFAELERQLGQSGLESFRAGAELLGKGLFGPRLTELRESLADARQHLSLLRAEAGLYAGEGAAAAATAAKTADAFEEHATAAEKAATATEELTGAQKRLAEAGKFLLTTSAQEQRFDRAAEMTAENIKFMQDFVREAERNAPELEEALSDPFKNALESVQTEFTSTFESISRGAITSFQDVATSAQSIFTNLSANLASLAIFDPKGFSALAARQGISPTLLGGAAFAAPAIGLATGLFGNQSAQQGIAIGSGVGTAAGAIAGSFIPGIGTALGAIAGGLIGSAGGGIFGGLFGGGGDDKVRGGFSGRLGSVSTFGDSEIGSAVREIDEALLGLLNARQETLVRQINLPSHRINVSGGLSSSDLEAIAARRVGPIAEALGFNRGAVLRGDAEQAVQNLATALQTQRAIEDLTGSVTVFERQSENLADQFADLEQNARRFGISTAGMSDALDRATQDLQRQQDAQVAALLSPFEALSAPLEQFQRDLEFAQLSPAAAFARAQQEFERIAAAAEAGSIPAIRDLQAAGQLFVNLAGQVGASPGQAAAVEAVQSSVSEVLARVEVAQLEAGEGVEGAINRASQAEIDTLTELRDDINEGLRRLERAVREG